MPRWEILSFISVGIALVVALAVVVLELIEQHRQRAEKDEHEEGDIW